MELADDDSSAADLVGSLSVRLAKRYRRVKSRNTVYGITQATENWAVGGGRKGRTDAGRLQGV
jgi:hypothetical protein